MMLVELLVWERCHLAVSCPVRNTTYKIKKVMRMDLLQRSVAEYEKEFEMLEKYQITDPQDPDFGGYYNKDFGVVAQNCGSAAAKPMTLYFCPQSRYYKDPAHWPAPTAWCSIF